MQQLTLYTAIDMADKGIRVNAICPSWVRTPMFEAETAKNPATPDLVKAMIPLGRPIEVDEVGSSIVYLCSPAASFVSGTALLMDSGATLMGVKAN